MNIDQEFEALRRLLKLKRYENPPPRYFNEFSGEVIARIRAGAAEDRSEPLERMEWESPLLQRVLSFFQSKPLFAGGFGAALCIGAVTMVALMGRPENQPKSPFMTGPVVPETGANPLPAFVGASGVGNPATTPGVTPVALQGAGAPTNSIFDMLQPPTFRVNWEPR
jgi:hypothetical protein